MNKPLVLHERTNALVTQYLRQPSHAVLILGSDGIGKGSVARHIATQVLSHSPADITTHPYVSVIEPEGTSISVETVRNVQRFLQLKTLGTKSLRRAIIVEHAEAMTTEAQNAFLKLLEEPPADTIVIMTASNRQSVLPTILSRTQTLHITTPSKTALQEHFNDHDSQKVDVAYLMSGGLPGLMHAVLEENESHPLLASVQHAKKILAGTTFERLAMIEAFAKQREEAKQVTEALRHIAETTLLHTSTSTTSAKIKQWHKILSLSTTANEQLAQSANTKLVLTNLMLQL